MTDTAKALARDIAIIRQHLEIAEVSKRTQALMPSIVNFKDALARLATLEAAMTPHRPPPDAAKVEIVARSMARLDRHDPDENSAPLNSSGNPVPWWKRYRHRAELILMALESALTPTAPRIVPELAEALETISEKNL